jgi:hypothetical protein
VGSLAFRRFVHDISRSAWLPRSNSKSAFEHLAVSHEMFRLIIGCYKIVKGSAGSFSMYNIF